MVLGILALIIILGIILIIAKKNRMDLLHLFLPLARGKIVLDEDGNLYESEVFRKNKWLGVLLQVIVFLLILAVLLEDGRWKLVEGITLFLPTYLTLEWIVYLGLIIVINGIIIFFKSKDLLVLLLSTVFAIIYAIIVYGKEQFFILPLLMIVIINMIQTISIMYKLCISENDFLKEEFERVTAVKQIFVILFIIMIHLCNFVIVVYFYCNGKTEGFLLKNNMPVTKLKDVVYYVVITYSTVGYGDIVPGCSDAQLFAIIISITSMLTTAVIIGKITSATISSVVTNKGTTTISDSDVEKYLSSIKNIISNDGKIVVASRNREFLAQNNMSVDTIKDILLNLKASDYEVSDIDLRAKESDMIQIFMPIYKGKKLYLKLKIIGDSIYCMSLHETASSTNITINESNDF